MRPLLAVLVAVLVASCASVPPAPQCCPATETTVREGTLHERARAFQSLIDDKLRQHWPFGGLINVQFADLSMKQVVGYNDSDDSAIWTGTYAAAQAFRYAASPAAEKPAALESVRRAVDALHTMATAPGYPGGLARIVAPELIYLAPNCTAPITPPCYETNGRYWLGETSRDQYTGWFFGMAIAWRLVDDPQIRAIIRDDVRTVITAIHAWNYKIHGPDGKPDSGTSAQVHQQMRLAWHLIAATILNEPLYWKWYEEQTTPGKIADAWLEDAVDWTNVYYDYYGFNLGILNSYNLIVLEPDPKRRAQYLQWFEKELYRYVKGTDNVFFDYAEMAVSGQASPETIAQDRKALTAFPGPPSLGTCVQPPPRPLDPTSVRLYRLNRAISHFAKMIAFPQSATPYPLDQRCRNDFLWQQSPYKESCCCPCAGTPAGSCPQTSYSPVYCGNPPTPQPGVSVYPGADFLLAYWMGRHHGFLGVED